MKKATAKVLKPKRRYNMSYTNGFDDGYKKGYKDGYEKQKQSSVGGYGITEVLWTIASPQVYMDTFNEGYAKGFYYGLFIFNQEQSLKSKVNMLLNAN
jgi:flagellar biosynthesis/type III secretory pathway protein FliH